MEFQNADQVITPAVGAFAITPDDGADLDIIPRAVYLGVVGDLAVVMADGSEVTFTHLVAGVPHPLRVRRVLEASTATGIVGVY